MRIVNTSKEPYEFTFDGKIYGPILPGEIRDFPYEVANHAIIRSVTRDEVGNITSYRMETLGEVKMNPEKFRSIVTYTCPFVDTEECNEKPFKSLDALRQHMEIHFDKIGGTTKPPQSNSNPQSAPSQNQRFENKNQHR